MTALSDYVSGTITLTNGLTAFSGTGTGWKAADFREGDTILGIEDNAGVEYVIQNISDNGAGTLTQPWAGASGTYSYRMRYLADGARVTAQARNLIELLGNGNLQALAGLTGPGVPVFNGPHAMTIKPEADFINGVFYDVQVDNLADRDEYNAQSAGFSVLVSDNGDGRSALYSKASNTSGDWSDPAYITGPRGGAPDIASGTTTTLAPGSNATFTVTSDGSDGYLLNAGIPAGKGFIFRGAYSGVTAYALGDVVRNNNSSWIALQTTTGNAPPTLPSTSNAYWELLVAAGANGTGTGDVVGPALAVDNRIAVFDGTTGKLLKDGGSTIAALVPADGSITNAKLASVATGTIKGRAAAGTGVPSDLTAVQVRTILGVREVLAATRNYYVRTDGSDSNDGLSNTSGGAFLTLQKAVNTAVSLDLSVYSVNINVADGTYTVGASLPGYVGVGPINIIGNVTTPANVIFNTTSSSLACVGGDWSVDGVRVNSSAGYGIIVSGGLLTIKRVAFGVCGAGHLAASAGGKAYLTNNYSIVGAAPAHFYVIGGGQVVAQNALTLTIAGTPAFALGFLNALGLGYLSIANITYSGAATGKRYDIVTNSVAMTGGATLPGSVAGTVATGGQYS